MRGMCGVVVWQYITWQWQYIAIHQGATLVVWQYIINLSLSACVALTLVVWQYIINLSLSACVALTLVVWQ
jgi:hypothetical protein